MILPSAFSQDNESKRSRSPRTSRRRWPSVERLEDRAVPTAGSIPTQAGGEVIGRVFRDLNDSGGYDSGEPGLAQRVVYADANTNGQFDPGEISTTTDATGDYELDLAPGRYTIRLVPGPAETITSPVGGSYGVTVATGFANVSRDFGILASHPLAPLPSPTSPSSSVTAGNEAYVEGLYRNLLGRNASPAELASWSSRLPAETEGTTAAGRLTRVQVAQRIWNLPERRELEVRSAYLSLLHRQASSEEVAAGVRALRSRAGEVNVVRRLLNSAEYRRSHPTDSAFVTALYNDVVGRAPNAEELTARVRALRQGQSRRATVNSLLFSTESVTRLVGSFYAVFLNRPADPAALAHWVPRLRPRAIDPRAIGAAILASNENFLAGPGPGAGLGGPSAAQDLPTMPGPSVDCVHKVLWYDESAQLKFITITNNSDQTVYPILQAANSRTTAAGDPWYGTPVFDPHDNLNNEYRGYVGYSLNGKDYLGLPAHQTITINVPLVFWDGGRINIATDPTYLTPPNPTTDNPSPVNPFHFLYYNTMETDLASATAGSDVLTFTELEGNSGVTPDTLANNFIPNQIKVTGPGIPDNTFIQSLGSGSLTLTQDAIPAGDSMTNVQYTFTWPIPTAGELPAGPPTDRFVVDSVPDSGTIDGRIMWYHALASQTPANDAPTQLLEMTFRDDYLSGLSTAKRGLIPESEQHALANYDVSYVDSILQPVAMEATNVPVQGFPTDSPPYGWIGAAQTASQLQAKIAAFTASNTPDQPNANGLGQYFGGKGYPHYYYPDPSAAGIKLPSGQNLFGDSPYNDVRSSYDNDRYALVSGGTTTIMQTIGGTPQNTSDVNFLYLSTAPTDLPKLKALAAGLAAGSSFDVTSSGDDVAPGTKLSSVELDYQGQPTGRVFLSTTTTGTHKPWVYTFTRPASDYAAGRLINLWYSWANYYVTHTSVDAQSLSAGTTVSSRVLTLTSPVAPGTLAPGMLVQGPNIPAGCTVTAIGADGVSVSLSKVASATTGAPATYAFTPPQMSAILGASDPIVGPLITFTQLDPATALAFSQNVYEVMTAMSTIAPDGSPHPLPVQLMFNVIGCNVGKLVNIQGVGPDKDAISNEIRDATKSLLRGVPDFKTDPEANGHWYPDPSVPTGGQDYNVYNLDPFVWFVHKMLGLSGYGFSVDDDVADVGANLATKLHVGIAGLGNPGDAYPLPQQAEWTFGAPYGPVSSPATVGADLKTISLADSKAFWQAFPSDENAGLLGALVNGPGVTPGTRVVARNEAGNQFVLGVGLDPSVVTAGSSYTFSFYGPVTGAGLISAAAPTLITDLDPAIIAQLTILGPGVLVTGPGIPKGTKLLRLYPRKNSVELSQGATPTQGAVRFTFS